MTLVKEPDCHSDEVTRKVLSLVYEAQQVTDVGAELSFILPSSATPHFPQLFEALDGNLITYIGLLNDVTVFTLRLIFERNNYVTLSSSSLQGRAWYLQFRSVSNHHGGGVHEGERGHREDPEVQVCWCKCTTYCQWRLGRTWQGIGIDQVLSSWSSY